MNMAAKIVSSQVLSLGMGRDCGILLHPYSNKIINVESWPTDKFKSSNPNFIDEILTINPDPDINLEKNYSHLEQLGLAYTSINHEPRRDVTTRLSQDNYTLRLGRMVTELKANIHEDNPKWTKENKNILTVQDNPVAEIQLYSSFGELSGKATLLAQGGELILSGHYSRNGLFNLVLRTNTKKYNYKNIQEYIAGVAYPRHPKH